MSETCFLIRPTEAYRDSYLEALREGFNFKTAPLAAEGICAIEADFAGHLRALDHDGQKRFLHGDREGRERPFQYVLARRRDSVHRLC